MVDKRSRAKTRSPSVTRRSFKSKQPIAVAREGARPGIDLITAVRQLGQFGAADDAVDPSSLELGERVRSARIARGWTQSQLARRAKCSQSDISDLERGRVGPQGPSLRTLVALANALQIELPIGPRAVTPLLVEADMFGEVKTANTDYCTAYTIIASDEWDKVREYVSMNAVEVPHAEIFANMCTLYTLGSRAEIRNLRAHTPTVVTLVRGDGRFVTHSPGRRNVRPKQGGVLAILDGNMRMEVEARGDSGLTMMMVPIQTFKRDDELAC